MKLMSRIYRQAELIASWVGEASSDSDEAMRLIETIGGWGGAVRGEQHLDDSLAAGFPSQLPAIASRSPAELRWGGGVNFS